MKIGLNAGFGHPLALDMIEMARYGFVVARQDVFASLDLGRAQLAGISRRALHAALPDWWRAY
jgi:hypothetical protein